MTQQKKQANVVTEFLRGKKFQLKGTLFYPHLLAPKIEPNKAPKYSGMLMWSHGENAQTLQAINQLLGQVKQQFHPNVPMHGWTNPVKDFNTTRKTDGSLYPKFHEGKQWINFANTEKFAPQLMIVDATAPQGMRALNQMDAMQLYDGQQVVVSISFFGLNGENSRYGASTNADAVLVIGGGTRVVTEHGVDVNQAFGNFVSQMGGQAPQQQYTPQAQNSQQQNYYQNQGQTTYPSNQPQQQNYYQNQNQNQNQGQNNGYNQQFNQQFGQNGGGGYNGNGGNGLV